MALSKEFFSCGWNIFDLIIVSASLIDLSFELVDGLSVLRCLRLVSKILHQIMRLWIFYLTLLKNKFKDYLTLAK